MITDGHVLKKVEAADIKEGCFQFPDGVTTIGDCAFSDCAFAKEKLKNNNPNMRHFLIIIDS